MKTTTAQALLKKVQQNYNDIAEEFSHTRVYPWKDIDILTKYIKEGDNVLDIGCGNGRLNESLKDKKIFYNGIDNSINLIIKAQHKYPEQYFQIGDMLKLPFVKMEFDVAMAIAVFHHIPSFALRKEALLEVRRVLKPHGYLLMTNWNLWQPKYRLLIYQNYLLKILGIRDLDWGDVFIPWKTPRGIVRQKRYYHAFTLNELEKLATAARFKIVGQFYSSYKAYNIISIWQKL
jgi:ubiquinone/menaquinone biosynthesis C-methylase UbiE